VFHETYRQLQFNLRSASATHLAPYTVSKILPPLQDLAVGVAKPCSGGNSRTLRGQRWYPSDWDDTADFEEQMSATDISTSNLIAFQDMKLASNVTSEQKSSSTQHQAAVTSSTDKPNDSISLALAAPLWASS
jgi:hypothetical protein